MYLLGFLQIFLYFVQCVVVSSSVCKDINHRTINDGRRGSVYCTRDLNVSCDDNSVYMSWIPASNMHYFDHYGLKILDKSNSTMLMEEGNIGKNLTKATFVLNQTAEEMLVKLETYMILQSSFYTYTENACRLGRRLKGVTPVDDEPVVINVTLKGRNVEGSTASLLCQANGCVPECTSFSWYKVGSLLDRNRASERTLLFRSLQRTDAGQYICSASDSRNMSANYKSFSLQVKYGPKTVKITSSATKYVAGESVSLSCEADCYPLCSFKIIKKPSVVSNSTTYYIASLHPEEDDGTYYCLAKNEIGNQTSENIYFNVEGKPYSVQLTSSMDIRTGVQEGSQGLTLYCNAKCNPICNFTIEKDGGVYHGSRNKTFHTISKDDKGKYKCLASNEYGHIYSNEKHLLVLYGPKLVSIIGPPGNYLVLNDIEQRITCEAECYPECRYSWYRNGNLVRGQRQSQYEIAVVMKQDEGSYTCRANNTVSELGSDPLNLPVQVRPGRLEISYSPRQVFENTNVSLSCKTDIPCIPECSYLWYDPLQKANVSYLKTYEISRIRRGDSGRFKCTAFNSFGTSTIDATFRIYYTSVKISVNKRHIEVRKGARLAAIRCENDIDPYSDCWPPYLYKNGRITFFDREKIAAEQDSGEYVCKASCWYRNARRKKYTVESKALIITVLYDGLRIYPSPYRRKPKEGGKEDDIRCELQCEPQCRNLSLFKNYKFLRFLTEDNKIFGSRNLTRYDSGTYNCKAVTQRNRTIQSEYFEIDVQYGPRNVSISGIVGKTFIRGENKNEPISCSADDCNPPCRYRIKRLNGIISSVARNGQFYYVYPVKSYHEGNYTCEAYNTISTATSASQYLAVFVKPTRPTITQSQTSVKENDNITWTCSVSCKPPCQYMWYDYQTRRNVSNTEHLVFKRVSREDNNNAYRCSAYNQFGQEAENKTLTFRYGPILTILSKSNRTVKDGSNVTLHLYIEANPTAHVYVEPPRAGYLYRPSDRYLTYVFKNVSCDLTGRYNFTASNTVGRDVEEFLLLVLCAPWIPHLQEKKYAVERKPIHSSVMKSYKVQGYPPPKATWKFKKTNSRQTILRVGERDTGVELYSNGSYCHIVIDNIQKYHFGLYYIKLSNSEGSLELTFELLPKGSPLPPSDVAVQCAAPGQANLIWRPQFSGGSPQTFKIYLRTNYTWDVLEDNITDARDIQGRITMSVDHLRPGVLHEFRVVAINDDMVEVIGSNEANCTVLGYHFQSSKDDLLSGIIGEVVGLVVVVIIVASLLMFSIKLLKKRNNQETDGIGMRNNALYGLTPVAPTGSEGNNVYSMANSTSTCQPAEQADEEKPVYTVASQLPSQSTQGQEGNTYAVANYPTGDTDYVYSVTQTMATKQEGDKARDNDNVYSVANYEQEKGNEKQEQVYTEVNKEKKSTATKPKKSTKGGKPSIFPKPFWIGSKPSRMKNKDGLIYVEVDVKKLSKDRKGYIVGAENKTEYEEIDFTKHADPLPDTPPETSSETEEK